MGEVYRARDARLGRDVAVKVLPAAVVADPERLRRFEQEARAAGALNHPNILVVHDAGQHDGMPYLVTELLEGETLRERLLSGPLAARKAVEFAGQIASGLAAAHEKGIVHRDLKPENVFLTRQGQAKILDFGLARLVGADPQVEDSPTRTRGTDPGSVLGTAGYMSPEQVRGQTADHRSDIFSFGVVLYETLTGERAFRRGTTAEAMTAILKEEPPELPEGKALPPALDRLVRHCLEKRREDRFQSARDMAFDLQALSVTSGAGQEAGRSRPRFLLRMPLWAAGLALVATLVAGLMLGRAAISGTGQGRLGGQGDQLEAVLTLLT